MTTLSTPNLFMPNLFMLMPRNRWLRSICAGALLCAAAGANADSYNGQIAWHNDVIHHTFVVQETSDLVAWTDSYLDGTNFDPILAVWYNGQQLMQVDDNPYLAPGQTVFDAGLRLYGLAPGTYVFTVAAYDNFANDTGLASGFWFDQQVPIPLAQWCQPYSNCNMGPDLALHWTLTPSVPEPSAWALLAAGGALLGAAAWRRRHAARDGHAAGNIAGDTASQADLIRRCPRRSTSCISCRCRKGNHRCGPPSALRA